ncbi:MAG: C39 family peptidase [Chloroflexota bacterium]
MMRKFRWLSLLLALLFVVPTLAQDATLQTQDEPRPESVMLDGFTWIHQGTNRCSAAALTIQLSFFEEVTADTYRSFATQELNTWGADASVRIEEMAQVMRDRGLGAIVRRGGTVDLMKDLVAAGFPVLVENSYFEGGDLYRDWLSHNRVLVGYDDTISTFYFQDPLLGYPQGDLVTYEYDDYDTRWRPFNRDYLVVYNMEEEAIAQDILGEDWDEMTNAENVRDTAQAEINAGQTDGYAYHNLGWAEVQLGNYEAAAEAFDQARAAGLPLRMFWYEFGVFEAYLAVERYQDVINLVNTELANAGQAISIEEWYYYAGQAYEGLGNTERAIINYQVAVTRNTNFTEAADRLVAIQGE